MTTLLETSPLARTSQSPRSIFECLDDPRATELLPSLRSMLDEMRRLSQQEGAHLQEITRLVQADQSMSLNVLRIANSAYYGPPIPIADLQSAIAFIGLNILRSAVASMRCLEQTTHIPQDVLDWKEFWIHATGVGHIVRELAGYQKTPRLPPESYYLMGLFHDIGKIVLASLMPEEFTEIYRRAGIEDRSVANLEQEVLGIEHGHLGAWYMEKQGIPLTIREPVRFHHSGMLDDKPHVVHSALIRLADSLAHYAKIGCSGSSAKPNDPFLSQEWPWFLAHCQIPEKDCKTLKSVLLKQVTQIGDLVREIIP